MFKSVESPKIPTTGRTHFDAGRESALLDAIRHELAGRTEFALEERRLNIGDVAVCKDGALSVVVERKTLDDLASSILDGRIEKQTASMRDLTMESGSAVMLVEGRPTFPDGARIHGKLQYTRLESEMLSWQIAGGLLLRSRDVEDSARLVVKLALMSRLSRSMGLCDVTAPPPPKTGFEQALACLMRLKGIGRASASKLLQQGTLLGLLHAWW